MEGGPMGVNELKILLKGTQETIVLALHAE
jgi:hypothetical protein